MANQLQLLRLQLSADQLDALRGATDALLNVPAATTTAKEFGRTAALGALHGRAVMEAKLANHAGSVAKARHLPLKRRRRSGRSNWPSSKEGRSLLRTRTAERRAAGLSSTVVTSSAAAALSDRERDAVRALRDQVAQRLGVQSGELSAPTATVEMVACDSLCTPEGGKGLRVEVALHTKTRAPEFDDARVKMPKTLAAGEAVVYASTQRSRRRQGDWRRTIAFAWPTLLGAQP
jgi:hypothetical protein